MIVHKQKKIALIHVAKKTVGLDDVAYRALLLGVAGIASLTEKEHEDQFQDTWRRSRNSVS